VTRCERYRESGFWRDELLTDRVASHARAKPSAIAIVDGEDELTWHELFLAARQAAAQLTSAGVTRHDVVSTQLPNGSDIVVLHLAIELLGGIHNPLAVQFREHELNQIAALVQPKIVIHPGQLDGIDYSVIHANTAMGKAGKAAPVGCFTEFTEPGSTEVKGFERSVADPQDGAFILNTSGTVAIKGVLHTHEDAMFSTRTVGRLIGLEGSDGVVCAIPMTWGGGLGWGLRFSLHHGATLISIPKWDPERAALTIDAQGGTYIYGPPTLARDLVHLAPDWRPKSPLKMICAGAPIPRQLCADARDLLGMKLFPGYGQTEHLHSTLGSLLDSEEKLTTTDGSPLPGVEIRVRRENGDECDVGEVGDIECRGPNVASEYFRQPDLTALTFKSDGWQVTQDLGSIDAEGYLRVAGRKRDIIIRGGLNVSPREVEELLTKHPDARDAAVVGYADPRYGERICAFVVSDAGTAPTVSELSSFLSEMGVARYKHPERVESIDALPLTTTGKVRHETLREILKGEVEI
jgi:non-ribosomal peptide synthetase component E (peptide arylation enzyme)